MARGDWSYYEWIVEDVDKFGDILDVHHADKLADLPADHEGPRALVKDDQDGRAWAYLDAQGNLPEYFTDASERQTAKVPKRFHEEVQKQAK